MVFRRHFPISIVLILMALFGGHCFADDIPAPVGYVNDFAGVISPEYRDKLTTLVAELKDKTTAEIAVVTVQSIAPYEEKQYARMIFDKWKIGKKVKDNGVLVLLAIKERRWRIETGYGVEGILPDGLCGEIGRNFMIPYFKDGKYAEGLYYGVIAIAQIIAKDANIGLNADVSLPKRQTADLSATVLLALIFSIVMFAINLSVPLVLGIVLSAIFSFSLVSISPLLGLMMFLIAISAIPLRFHNWKRQPSHKRPGFFGPQTYMGGYRGTSGGSSWGGGGGFGGGGFGGGGGGGGGAGGGF